jgi:hypothetical protein
VYPLPAPGSAPGAITGGPDGNVWFTEQFPDQIGTIDLVTHAITELPIPGQGPGHPSGLAVGPDGNPWFLDTPLPPYTPTPTSGPGGTPIPLPGENVGGPAANPIVFPEFASLNPATRLFTEYAPAPPPNTGPDTFTFGPDGALWYLDASDPGIGRLQLSPAAGIPAVVTLSASAATAIEGEPVTLSASVAPAAASAGTGAVTGDVTFTVDGASATTVPLSGSGGIALAHFTDAALAAGTHTFTALYTGDATYAPSAAPVVSETVQPSPLPATSVTLAASAAASTFSQTVTFTA